MSETLSPLALAGAALLPHLHPRTRFIEPCAGKGDLVRQLVVAGHQCVDQFDIAPRGTGIRPQDALEWESPPLVKRWGDTMIITNPPFEWPLLRDLITCWRGQVALQWLLLEADFAHTKRAGPLMQCCRRIVSIGRLKWVEGSAHGSTKNYAWYLFGTTPAPGNTAQFHSRGWTDPQKGFPQ